MSLAEKSTIEDKGPLVSITLHASVWKVILDAVENHWDRGPDGEGWQSPELSAASGRLWGALQQKGIVT